MTAHATALAEEVFAVVDGLPLHIAAHQHHVGSMAVLATRFCVLLGKQRPQPVLVVSMRFLRARGRASVSLMAGRAAELLRIVNPQQFGLRMAHQRIGVFIRLLLTFRRHRRRSDFQRLARVHVAGFAAVDDIGICNVDLHNRRNPFGRPSFQSVDLLRREIDHVIGDVFIQLGPGRRYRLQHFTQFQAQLRALVANLVVFFFELGKGVPLLASVGEFDRCLLVLVALDFLALAGLGGIAGAGFEFVGQRIYIGAAVGEHALHGEQARAGIVKLLARLFALRLRILIGFLVGLFEGDVIRIFLNVRFRRSRLGARRVQESAVAVSPLLLEGLPGPLCPRLVPQGPEQRRHQNHHRDQVIGGVRLSCDRVLLGVGLFRHRFLRKPSLVVGR